MNCKKGLQDWIALSKDGARAQVATKFLQYRQWMKNARIHWSSMRASTNRNTRKLRSVGCNRSKQLSACTQHYSNLTLKKMSVQEMRDLGEAAIVPKDIKQLRACLHCHVVKTAKQFER